jgi:hypothetical protein
MRSAAAQLAPIAPYTKSILIELDADEQGSGRRVIPFAWPVEVVGITSSVIANDATQLVTPVVADLLVDLTVNEQRRYTSAARDSDIASGSTFADLAALDLMAPRVLSIPMGGTSELGFELRWKRFTAGAAIYRDALVTISAFYRRVTLPELDELRLALGPND